MEPDTGVPGGCGCMGPKVTVATVVGPAGAVLLALALAVAVPPLTWGRLPERGVPGMAGSMSGASYEGKKPNRG